MITAPLQRGHLDWELIERVDIASGDAVSTYTFSDLNGELDGEYQLRFRVVMTTHANSRGLYFKPNNVHGTAYGDYKGVDTNAPSYFNNATAIILVEIGANKVGYSYGQLEMNAYDETSSNIQGMFVVKNDFTVSGSGTMTSSFFWNPTNGNITSLVLTASYGTFYGWFELYRKRGTN